MAYQPFIFGKLPAHGDFVWRGLSSETHDLWDKWASGEIESAREALGDAAFEAAHDLAPPYRFVVGPGGLGADWRAGAIAPSIDATGRRFLIVMGVDGLSAPEAAALGAALADRCEEALRRALVGSLDADGSLEELAGAAPYPGESAAAALFAGSVACEGVWWSLADGTIHAGASPPPGLISQAISQVAISREPDDL